MGSGRLSREREREREREDGEKNGMAQRVEEVAQAQACLVHGIILGLDGAHPLGPEPGALFRFILVHYYGNYYYYQSLDHSGSLLCSVVSSIPTLSPWSSPMLDVGIMNTWDITLSWSRPHCAVDILNVAQLVESRNPLILAPTRSQRYRALAPGTTRLCLR